MTQRDPSPRPQAVRTLRRQPTPPGIYASRYTPELASEILRRLAAGEALRAMCRDDPAMPTEKTVWNWRRAHPAFGAAYGRVLLAARRAALAAQAARDGRRGRRGKSGYGPEVAAAICDGLAVGKAIGEVCAAPGMPCVATVYNWLRAHPEFVAAYRWARELGFDEVLSSAAWHAPWLGSLRASEVELRRIQARALRRCGRLTPRGYADAIYGPLD